MDHPYKTIEIAGGGIAGLTAAIQLKMAGHNPVVYEKESQIGAGRHGDFEGLENWIYPQSMPAFLIEAGFDFTEIKTHSVSQFFVHTQNRPPFLIQNNSPFFYMVRRGANPHDIDNQLFHQCQKMGVQFELGKKAPENCHINATGSKKAAAYIQGINFQTELKDQVHLLLGHEYAPKGYAYLIIIDGKGTLATAYKKPKNSNVNPINNTREYFDTKGISINVGESFGSRGSFSLPFGQWRNPYQIGEAGGFQDYLFGFGIRMSMMSGRAAALSILGKKKEAKILLKELNRKRRLSFVNRILYERLNDRQMAEFAKKFSESSDPLSILSGAYAWNFKNILRWINIGHRYEIHPT
ncbi:MAG: NAD(P)-binding protein [Candidatus Marinimicrobia bacterium]|jgi:flavin-dependent dehydrogenase|nr:NAD(P)-binding protein [Candidatus Neomarinimicrobiota bacterium]MBT3675083.1 NAD(P)-binding protein [Candidatus Neomarinimicrobiota bacterium]MBT3763906.1 NAD(P)-binding protein [Candidatus Neomarinimicrobiota bacterium]MBT4067547.1 NAD(P)-binding protein [Candidatus Neomarinimicrobiota bacterium]MBT4269918.1 NAD(P)-binding protein [Candidatus Neomarinimicrobiota bacterium]